MAECIARLKPPTLGALQATADLRVLVPVTSFPANMPPEYVARVHWSRGQEEPGRDSGLWRIAGLLDRPGEVRTAMALAGERVWIRARGEAVGYRPSEWGTAVSLDLPGRAQFRTLELEGNTLVWSGNAFLEGVRLRWSLHSEGVDPVFGPDEDVAVELGEFAVPEAPLPGEVLTVEAEAWNDFYEGAVGGELGQTLQVSRYRTSGAGAIPAFLADTSPAPIQLMQGAGWSMPAYRANGTAAHVSLTLDLELPAYLEDGTDVYIPSQEA